MSANEHECMSLAIHGSESRRQRTTTKSTKSTKKNRNRSQLPAIKSGWATDETRIEHGYVT